MKPIEFQINSQLYSLKNTRDIFPIKAEKGVKCPHCKKPLRMITVPNAKAKAFEKEFKKQLPVDCQQKIVEAVHAEIEIFYPSNLQDLSEDLVLDCLQRYDVIENDRQIVSKYVRKRIDPENPRVLVKVQPVAWDRLGRQARLLDDEAEKPNVGVAV